MDDPIPRPLAGLTLVITRPQHQSHPLCEKIRALGGEPLVYPTLDIEFLSDNPRLWAIAKNLANYDYGIFTSSNGVLGAADALKNAPAHAPQMAWFAVGQRTALQLNHLGWPKVSFPPDNFCSEGLLAMAPLIRPLSKKILIFTGEGGRDYLEKELRQRGASVEKIAVYRRRCTSQNAKILLDRWHDGRIDAVLMTSCESLLCLHQQLGSNGQHYLQHTTLVVVSERVASTAKELGYRQHLIVAKNATDDEVLNALLTQQRTLYGHGTI